jgi:hypothetical protein
MKTPLNLKETELARIEKVEQLSFKDMLSTLDTTGITAEEMQHRWSKRGCPLDNHRGRRGFPRDRPAPDSCSSTIISERRERGRAIFSVRED